MIDGELQRGTASDRWLCVQYHHGASVAATRAASVRKKNALTEPELPDLASHTGAFRTQRREGQLYRRTFFLAASSTLALVAACASVDTQQTTTLNGVVETVDPVSRELLLRGQGGAQSGALLSMVVGPQVRRLDQIKPGDRVTVTYYQALAAQVVNVFSPQSQPFEGVSVDRRETAERPGAQVTRVRRGRVVITAVDPTRDTISFVGPNNVVRTVSPKNQEVQSFIRKLKVGDQVDIVYEEALAIAVEPMK